MGMGPLCPFRPDPALAARAEAFIRENLPLAEVLGTGVRLHLARPESGLSRLVGDGPPPYWSRAWPGGVALARFLRDNPGTIGPAGFWEIGAGSGLAGLAAARASGHGGWLLDADPLALVAARLNAEANGVGGLAAMLTPPDMETLGLARSPSGTPTILAGDVFYEERLARAVATWLDRHDPDTLVLVGDVGRAHLPRDRLEPLASYPVRDVGDPPGASLREGWVLRWVR
jgi:predicted nicotinamide N-methyase